MATEVKTTTCYMCACRCGIRVHLRDGEVRYIDGNPGAPDQQGRDLRQGRVRDHEAVLAGAADEAAAAQAGHRARRRRVRARSRGTRRSDPRGAPRDASAPTDPKKFALFTGRDQMQALTGLFARQFGTPNYAAHGGFCSVNMAAGMIYTIGGSFWEFGGPDLERAKLFVMIGTAEDHHSNPLKIAISKFKRAGGRFISINPVRTGYSAIADEWVPIRPGHRRRAPARAHPRDHRARPVRPRVPRALHQRRPAREPRRGQRRLRPARARRRPRRRGRTRMYPQNQLWWDRHRRSRRSPTARRGRRSVPARRVQRCPTARRVKPAFQLLASACALHARVGRARSPAFRRRRSAGSRRRWASPRATRRSSCRSPGPTPGARSTRRSPATRSRSTRCAASPRIRTASRPSARSRS